MLTTLLANLKALVQNGEAVLCPMLDVDPRIIIPKWAFEKALVNVLKIHLLLCDCGGRCKSALCYIHRAIPLLPSSDCWFRLLAPPGSGVWWEQSLILPAVLKLALMTSSFGLNLRLIDSPDNSSVMQVRSLRKDSSSLSLCYETNSFWPRLMWAMHTLPCIGNCGMLCQSSMFSRAKFVHIQDTLNSSGAVYPDKYCVAHG